MSFSTHANNKANNIYVLGDFLTQQSNNIYVLGDFLTQQYMQKNFIVKTTEPGKKFMLSLHYNSDNSYLFVNGTQELKFKAKNDHI